MSNALPINAESVNLIKSIVNADSRVKESSISYGILGGHASLCVKVFYQTKDEAPNGILRNAPHRFIMLHDDGEMVNLTGYKTAKFRQGKVKSVEEFAGKIQKYLAKALEVGA